MKKTYINGVGCVSAQKTYDTVFLEEVVLNENENLLPIQIPVIKISFLQLRYAEWQKALKTES